MSQYVAYTGTHAETPDSVGLLTVAWHEEPLRHSPGYRHRDGTLMVPSGAPTQDLSAGLTPAGELSGNWVEIKTGKECSLHHNAPWLIAPEGPYEPLLDARAFAEYIGVEYPTIRRYMTRGVTPPPNFVIGSSSAWWVSTVQKWVEGRSGRGIAACGNVWPRRSSTKQPRS